MSGARNRLAATRAAHSAIWKLTEGAIGAGHGAPKSKHQKVAGKFVAMKSKHSSFSPSLQIVGSVSPFRFAHSVFVHFIKSLDHWNSPAGIAPSKSENLTMPALIARSEGTRKVNNCRPSNSRFRFRVGIYEQPEQAS